MVKTEFWCVCVCLVYQGTLFCAAVVVSYVQTTTLVPYLCKHFDSWICGCSKKRCNHLESQRVRCLACCVEVAVVSHLKNLCCNCKQGSLVKFRQALLGQNLHFQVDSLCLYGLFVLLTFIAKFYVHFSVCFTP